jgi:D-glycero-beta-D-manno-heptose-7-phosphate kinase
MIPEIIHRFLDLAPSQHVLIAGDAMLDAYVSGEATRISPEAPVPVVGVSKRRYTAGGAANVAANVRAMGARATLAGITGVDEPAIRLRRELERMRIETSALIEDPMRVTTIKTRITAGGQQIVRFDEEDASALTGKIHASLLALCESLVGSATACVISDYAKGVVTDELCRCLIDAAGRHGKPVVVDPKSRNLARYRGAAVITPNLKETGAAAGMTIRCADDLTHAASAILEQIAPSALLVTRGGEGMSLFENGFENGFEPGKTPWPLAAHNIEVADVTGAGDTVAGVLAIALGIGFNLRESAALANLAAGLAVRHVGTWAVQPEEMTEAAGTLAETSALHAH